MFSNNKQEPVAAAADTVRNNILIHKSARQQVQGAAKKDPVKPNGQGDKDGIIFNGKTSVVRVDKRTILS